MGELNEGPPASLVVSDGWSSERSVCGLVVDAVAAAEGVEPEALPPLEERVDTDALEDLFAPRSDGTPRRSGTVRFEYGGRDVVVTAERD